VKRKALFLDRDGVINIDYGYVHEPENCVFIEGIFELVRRANAAGYVVAVVTNQAGIGRGYFTEAHDRPRVLLSASSASRTRGL
jgi:D-glycero-D-manno-heptose 1,7-bisphosphate phosphatase